MTFVYALSDFSVYFDSFNRQIARYLPHKTTEIAVKTHLKSLDDKFKTVSKLGRNFLNLLYKDSKASCNVYFNRRNGMYKMKDFGNDDYSGDCSAAADCPGEEI